MQIATSSVHVPAALPSSLPLSSLPSRQLFLKRQFDIFVAALLLVLGSVLFLVIAVIVRLTSRGPVFFRQTRVGYAGHEFTMYKFRTMEVGDESRHRDYALRWIRDGELARQASGTFKLEDDPRITPFGRLLRSSSLDELPQLWNVLRGDMSLVGPRPAIPYEVAEYDARQRQRLGTLPGITGFWQVSGRNQLSFDRMVELDVAYIRNWTLGTDVAILLKTIPAVLLGTGH